MTDLTATNTRKIAQLEAQIRAVRRGATNVVTCPWCSIMNGAGEACCDTFIKAGMAVMDRLELEERAERLYEIQEAASRN